ncbi:hypothetical protein D5F11_015075 [Siminovitchia terrae]|uniref:Uncharacterized protein n=1 Tax=Siminovitchia terrae TaxID=1914933 RepID=A0A429X6E6_SIMTE|nr:hypothetical protein D5F11_015075 [Siminovitchia terrae]
MKEVHYQVEKSNGQSDLLPLLPKERTWGSFDFSMVNIGLAIATWCFLIGGTLSLFVGLKMGLIATLAGNTISVLFVALSNAIPSSRYGIDQYIFLRSIFGKKGTKIPVILMVIVEFGWVATLAVMFGKASSNAYGAITNTPAVSNTAVTIFALIAIVISWIIVSRGSNSINWLNRIVAPLLVTMLIVMFYMLSQQYSFGEMLALQPISPFPNDLHNYIVAFELGLGSGFSWWPIMGGLTRLTKSERAALWPNMIGVNICAVLGTMIGLLAGLAIGDSDPTAWMIPIGGAILGLVALIIISFANVTAMTSLVFSTCMALKQIKFFRNMKWENLTLLFLACTAVFVFFPDAIYGNFSLFLAACGTVFGPLSTVMFVDYYLLRKQQIDMRALYLDTPGKPYDFVGGYNFTPIISVAISTIAYFLILDPISLEGSTFFDYASATLPAMLLAGILYYVITKFFVIPKGMGGYHSKTDIEKNAG